MKKSATTANIAKIARVPAANHPRFVRLLDYAIRIAKPQSDRPRNKFPSAGAIRKDFLDPVTRAAGQLRVALERLQGEHLKAGEAAQAEAVSICFSEALRPPLRSRNTADPIADLVQSLMLSAVIEAGERASEHAKIWFSKKSGPKKGSGRSVFNTFVMQLLAATELTGGKLTIYHTSYNDAGWDGTLLKSIEQLRPFLPKANFFPAGRLGAALDTARSRQPQNASRESAAL